MAEHKIRFKRIIDGKSYNTETSALLARWDQSLGPCEQGELLFMTRHGAHFLFKYDDSLDPWEDGYQSLIPLEPEQAQRWAEQYCDGDVVESIFGEMPEAGETEAKITLRMPELLRRRAAAVAEAKGQSMNAAIVRWVEYGVAAATKSS